MGREEDIYIYGSGVGRDACGSGAWGRKGVAMAWGGELVATTRGGEGVAMT